MKTFSINPPTDKEIEKVLYTIINKEGANNLALNKFQIEDIKIKANRDLRSAIQLLQFYTAGRLGGSAEPITQLETKPKRKKLTEAEKLLQGDNEYKPEKKNDGTSPYK